MDDDQLNERITTVEAGASKKKPTEQFGNITAHTTAEATVMEGDDPDEVLDALNEWVVDQNEKYVMERYEEFVRQEDDE